VPFLDLVHVRERRCAQCHQVLAQAGSRSFIVDTNGLPVDFDPEKPPEQVRVELTCSAGHVTMLSVPEDVSAEATMMTPDDAPIALDAVLLLEGLS